MKIMRALKLRKRIKAKKPGFKRQEWFKCPKLGIKWRRPKGKDSKLKRGIKARGSRPSPGYSSPAGARGLDSSGHKPVRVFNTEDLNKIDPNKQIAVMGKTVGRKKRIEIIKRAEEKGIKISNFKL